MARRHAGSKVALGLCTLALGLCSVGFSVRYAMTACAVTETPGPHDAVPERRYVFEWEACEGSERLLAIQRGIALWGAVGAGALLTAVWAFRSAPRVDGEAGSRPG